MPKRALLTLLLVVSVTTSCSGWTTTPAEVTQTTAKLRATVSCEGNAASNPCVAWFRYWPAGNPGTAQDTPHTNPVGQQVTEFRLTATVTGLTPDTAYLYRVCGYGDQNIPAANPQCSGPKDLASEAQTFATCPRCTGTANTARTNLFAGYASNTSPSLGTHWMGGDGGASIELPDGRVAWLFNDPIVGPGAPNNHLSCNTPITLAHNALVMEQNGTLGPTIGTPSAPFIPAPPSGRYWGGAMVLETSNGQTELRVLAQRVPGTDRVVARFTVPANQNPQFVGIFTPTPQATSGAQPAWGNGILVRPDHNYVYGSAKVNSPTARTYLARTPPGNLLGTWEYWNGSGWTTDPNQVAALADPYGHEIAAEAATTPVLINGRYITFSVNGDSWFGFGDKGDAPRGAIQAWSSPSPSGPWSGPMTIYAPPETSSPGENFVYSLATHPEVSPSGSLVLSYSVSGCKGCATGEPDRDLNRSQPKFITVSP
jgi:hypothetical protein